MAEILKLRSSVKPELMRSTVMRGTVLAVFGSLILLYGTLFMPVEELSKWGWLMFFTSMGLIAFGLLPFRKLSKLERKPYEIIAIGNQSLLFLAEGRQLFNIPISTIKKIGYLDGNYTYGITIDIKKNEERNVVFNDPKLDFQKFQWKSKKVTESDFFLPYFTERAFQSLNDYITITE